MLDYIVIDGNQYSKAVLEDQSVDKLRQMVRILKIERKSLISGMTIAGLNKASCVNWLLNFNGDATAEELGAANNGLFNDKESESINVPVPTPNAASGSAEALVKALSEALAGAISAGKVNREEIAELITQEVSGQMGEMEKRLADLIKQQARTLVLERVKDGAHLDIGFQHYRFEALLNRCRAALAAAKQRKFLNIWLVGPAGGGKTTAAENVAKAIAHDLGRDSFNFEFNGALDSEHKLLGFVDANGKIVSRPFRRAWTEGGIYLFDEVDASMPGACLALNAALANGYCDFPDGKVDRHPECVVIASGNVWGGPTDEYVGRFQPDAAFADRFIKFRWDYDEKLERAISGNDKWVDYVQSVRRAVREKGIKKFVVSPRASMFGAIMLAAGIPWSEVVEDCVRKGLQDGQWNLIKEHLREQKREREAAAASQQQETVAVDFGDQVQAA
jgi:cobaltochelatase CobS